jgi:hypothetical protein
MEENEIFSLLASGVLEPISVDTKFKKIILKIMVLDKVAEFSSDMVDLDDNILNLDINMGYKYAKAIHRLYEITQNHPLEHKNWNRAIFTLYPDNKFDMEYIWDQELQDRVDGYNNESQS